MGIRIKDAWYLVVLAILIMLGVVYLNRDAVEKRPANDPIEEVKLTVDAKGPNGPASEGELPPPGTKVKGTAAILSEQLPDLPNETRPDLLVERMLPLAQEGSVDAMREVGRGMYECSIADRSSDVQIEQKFVDDISRMEERLKAIGQEFSVAEHTARTRAAIERTRAIRDACANMEDSVSRSWSDWMEKAARAGDERAMRQYIQWARAELFGRRNELWTLESSIRKRETAFDFAGRLLAAGDCDMLLHRSEFASSAETAYVYGFASNAMLRDAAIFNQEADSSVILQTLDSTTARLAANVPQGRLAAATESGRKILAAYCSR